ncbi:MAG: hypothetical protein K8T20_10445 [Planctomycetes bacterium]|nr:hypothetical protein [Planctomycetota bacterium]
MARISKYLSALCLVACLSAAATAQDAAPAVTDDPKTWPADVKTAYDEICALPPDSKDAAKSAR